MTEFGKLDQSLAALRSDEIYSFLSQLGQMFSSSIPVGTQLALMETTMSQWKEYWMLPAAMSAGIAVVFFFCFWDKSKVEDG